MDEGTLDLAELAEWNERNRRSREEYYLFPGPFYWITESQDKAVGGSKPSSRGIPPPTIRKALERALDDLARAHVAVHRRDRIIAIQLRTIINLEAKLGEQGPTWQHARPA